MISKQGQRDNDQRPVPGAKRHQAFDTDLIELRLSVSQSSLEKRFFEILSKKSFLILLTHVRPSSKVPKTTKTRVIRANKLRQWMTVVVAMQATTQLLVLTACKVKKARLEL